MGKRQKKFIEGFLREYKKRECLWNMKDKGYKNVAKKKVAYEDLRRFCERQGLPGTLEFVKSRINNLRTAFWKEARKVRESKKKSATGEEVYVPSLYYYDIMTFLLDQHQPKEPIRKINFDEIAAQITESVNQPLPETEKDDVFISQMVEIKEETIDSCSDEQDVSASNVCKSVEPTCIFPRNVSDNRSGILSSPESRRKRNLATTYVEDRNVPTDFLTATCNPFRKDTDEYDAIGMNVACKLRSFERKQTIIAEKLIADILFQGQMGTLNMSSTIYSPPGHGQTVLLPLQFPIRPEPQIVHTASAPLTQTFVQSDGFVAPPQDDNSSETILPKL